MITELGQKICDECGLVVRQFFWPFPGAQLCLPCFLNIDKHELKIKTTKGWTKDQKKALKEGLIEVLNERAKRRKK